MSAHYVSGAHLGGSPFFHYKLCGAFFASEITIQNFQRFVPQPFGFHISQNFP